MRTQHHHKFLNLFKWKTIISYTYTHILTLFDFVKLSIRQCRKADRSRLLSTCESIPLTNFQSRHNILYNFSFQIKKISAAAHTAVNSLGAGQNFLVNIRFPTNLLLMPTLFSKTFFLFLLPPFYFPDVLSFVRV